MSHRQPLKTHASTITSIKLSKVHVVPDARMCEREDNQDLEKIGGRHMRSFAESERFVECSGRIVLQCDKCEEALILLGREEDWQAERALFECHCGQVLALTDRRSEGVLT